MATGFAGQGRQGIAAAQQRLVRRAWMLQSICRHAFRRSHGSGLPWDEYSSLSPRLSPQAKKKAGETGLLFSNLLKNLVGDEGVEPPTFSVSTRRSLHTTYVARTGPPSPAWASRAIRCPDYAARRFVVAGDLAADRTPPFMVTNIAFRRGQDTREGVAWRNRQKLSLFVERACLADRQCSPVVVRSHIRPGRFPRCPR